MDLLLFSQCSDFLENEIFFGKGQLLGRILIIPGETKLIQKKSGYSQNQCSKCMQDLS